MAELNGANIQVWYVNAGDGLDGDTPADSTAQDRGKSASKAWATIQFAFDKIADSTIVIGDDVRIMKTDDDATNYGITAKLACAWSGKTVIINGANSSGVVDGTIVEINGDGLDSSTPMMEISVGTLDHTIFSHLKFNAADTAQHCVEATTLNSHFMSFVNCQFTSATSHGVYTNNNANYWNIINCRFDNNGGDGYAHQHSNYAQIYKCLFDNNAGDGGRFGGSAKIAECVFFNNGDDGAYVNNSGATVCNCVFDNNTGDGLYITGAGNSVVMNCIYTNNIRFGLVVGSGTETRQFNCAFYGNGLGSKYAGGTVHLSMYNYLDDVATFWGVTADFDFTPNPTSSVIGAGMPKQYKFFGSTASDIGLEKWINTESISVF